MGSTRKKVTVLLRPDEADRLEAYCEERGHKKSTLIARLIRDYLDQEQSRGPRKRRTAVARLEED